MNNTTGGVGGAGDKDRICTDGILNHDGKSEEKNGLQLQSKFQFESVCKDSGKLGQHSPLRGENNNLDFNQSESKHGPENCDETTLRFSGSSKESFKGEY